MAGTARETVWHSLGTAQTVPQPTIGDTVNYQSLPSLVSFTEAVAASREAGTARDALTAHVMRDVPAIPHTSDPEAAGYVIRQPGDSSYGQAVRERAAKARRTARAALVARHVRRIAATAHVGSAVSVPNSREARAAYVSGSYSVNRVSRRLTASQRDVLRFIVSSEVKQRNYAAITALGQPAETVRHGVSRGDSYGTVAARETRYSIRGAYGKRGIRGSMAQVSTRDAHIPASVTRQLNAVGHATIPQGWDSTREQRDALLEAVRRDSTLSTVRVRHGAPWIIVGQTIERVTYAAPCQALPAGEIVPVAAYRTAAEAKADAAREADTAARKARAARIESDAAAIVAARAARDIVRMSELGSIHADAA